MLEAHDEVVGVPDHDHVARSTGQFLKPGNGSGKSSPGISPMARRLLHFATTSSSSGIG
jgi:hypothetical protein